MSYGAYIMAEIVQLLIVKSENLGFLVKGWGQGVWNVNKARQSIDEYSLKMSLIWGFFHGGIRKFIVDQIIEDKGTIDKERVIVSFYS